MYLSLHSLLGIRIFALVSAGCTHLNAIHSHMYTLNCKTSGSQTTENEDEELSKASQEPTMQQPLPYTGSGAIMDEEEALGKVCNVSQQDLRNFRCTYAQKEVVQ